MRTNGTIQLSKEMTLDWRFTLSNYGAAAGRFYASLAIWLTLFLPATFVVDSHSFVIFALQLETTKCIYVVSITDSYLFVTVFTLAHQYSYQ